MTAAAVSAALDSESGAGAAPNVGIAFPGDPAAPATWSGTPSGVMSGLRSVGAEPEAVIATPPARVHDLLRDAVALAELPRSLRRDEQTGSLSAHARATLRLSRAVSRNTPAMGRVYTRAAHRAVSRARHLDGIVQIGTGFALPRSQRVVTFEDMTIPQAVEVGYPEWRALTRRQLENRLKSQRQAYEAAVACCFTTWWAARSAIEEYGVPVEKVAVVGVGRNHAVDPPSDRDWTSPRFLFVGWDWERKNGAAVLRAFERLRRDVPDARLDIVGKHSPVRAEGVTDHGVLRLDRPDERVRLEPLFRNATCFVMPSKCEPSALAYVEAMHAGLACIGTTVGGAANLIGDGGCVVNPASDDALFTAMRGYADPERAARVGAAARERSTLFTWPAVAARLLRALGTPAANLSGVDDAFVDRGWSREIS